MAGPVGDKADQVAMRTVRGFGTEFVQQIADGVHNVKVGGLIVATDVISFPKRPRFNTPRMASQ